MKRKITVGIVGCGKIPHVDHVPHLLAVQGVEITGLFDVLPDKMKVLDRAYSLNTVHHNSLESLLQTQPDAVVICTPNSLHYEQTVAALRAGCHVLCEKPMAALAAECSKMLRAAEKADRVLHINQTLHYLAPYATLAALVHEGKIGEVQHVRCLRFHTTSPDVGWSPGASWFVSRAFAGGIILDIGVHMADLMKWIAGPIADITAKTATRAPTIDVVDNARALIQFESGATGVLELSWTSPENFGLLEVYGTSGVLRLGFAPENTLELFQTAKNGVVKRHVPKTIRNVPTSQQAFVDAILQKKPSPTPGTLGRDAVALCEAIMKAGETGKRVKVKRFD